MHYFVDDRQVLFSYGWNSVIITLIVKLGNSPMDMTINRGVI